MLLILADPSDATARSLMDLARAARAPGSVRIASPMDIALATRWVHRVGARGVETEVRLRDGTTLHSAAIGAVINRMWTVPLPPSVQFDAADRAYAQSELHALVVSWLTGLPCPVIDPPSPHALTGAPLSSLRWQIAAHRAGLASAAIRLTSRQRRFPGTGMMRLPNEQDGQATPVAGSGSATFVEPVGTRTASLVVAGDTVWPESMTREEAAPLAPPCLRLARDAGVSLLRARFVASAERDSWRFAGADPLPVVQEPGPLEALLATIPAHP